jgi:hypothetical protein
LRSAIVVKVAEKLQLDLIESDQRLLAVEGFIRKIDSLNADNMTFDYFIDVPGSREPRPLLESALWRKLGDNLCSLGLHVGADVPRSPTEEKRTSIITALQNAANSEGRAVSAMLAHIETQRSTIQRQEKAITALQFRHLLEMVPHQGQAPPPRQATTRWKDFWRNAVTRAHREYSSHTTPPKPHPLKELLKKEFDYAATLKEKGKPLTPSAQLQWLLEKNDLNKRAEGLYGTLSDIIHNYSGAEFSVSTTYTPAEIKLLHAMIPKNITDGDVDWTEETQRYI